MTRQHYDYNPADHETVRHTGSMTTVVRFDIIKVEDGYECDEVEFPHYEPLTAADYGRLVAAIIRGRFSADDVEAIHQNYLEDKTPAHEADFNELKEWRVVAKERAREILHILK